ncbi:hypothetical protein H7I53_18375 [Mycolicibacterium pulveris]|uniref:Terminase n=1 Tax=Mycolicibacterium pulveris TaxID=36813 RepID=A0A7I7UTX9_MYCPV|nr:P27 family phage terminase small subunit [Mycolicibacterium pulveris]MCV6982183.1 hypothetical protein [Mycolicibacterium pulveris]BBY84171.1 hypothetical protein MPUL_53290 [Mycolicibacterium pulveris]
MTSRPRGLATAGRRLWDAVTADFDLDPPELALLEEACRARDLIAELRRKVAETGAIIDSNQGPRVHPAAVEARQQSLVLAKLVASLGLPKGVLDSAT